MCINLYDTTANYRQTYDDCHKLINTTLSKYNYQPRIPGKSSNPQAMQNMPYEIKILIYTMAYKAFELYDKASPAIKKTVIKPSQKGILEYIGTPLTASNYQCYKLSPKTFTQFGLSPKVFYDINNYKQIELPSSYAGAKVGYLGYALNHLIAYAGTIDNYVDLFGGSASAFMAVTQTNNVEYYINELDFFVVDYYKVLADDKLYNSYISELCKVRDKFKAIIETGAGVKEGKDFFKYCDSIANNWHALYPISNRDTLINGQIIPSSNWQQYSPESSKTAEEKKTDAAVTYTYIHSFSVTGGKNQPGAVNTASLKKFCDLKVEEYNKLHTRMARLKEIYNSNMLDETEFLIEYFTDKAPEKFHHVERLAKNMRNGNTPINISQEDQELLRLLKKDSNGKPKPFCTLFYSDSPYLNTHGYKGGSIDASQMKTLINKLVTASQHGSHFIFSCRASKTVEENTYKRINGYYTDLKEPNRANGNIILDQTRIYEEMSLLAPGSDLYGKRIDLHPKKDLGKITELLEQNNDIYEYIFREFEKYSNNFYVLACFETNGFQETLPNIETMLKAMMPVEVFITDYDFILPLDYTDAQGKTYRFNKYTISQFCNLLDENMFKSSKKYVVIPNSNDNQSGYSFQ